MVRAVVAVLEESFVMFSGDSIVITFGSVLVVLLSVFGLLIVIVVVGSVLSGLVGTAVLGIVVMEISEDVFIVVVAPEVDSHEYAVRQWD